MAAEYRTVAAADDWRLPGCSDFCRKQRVVLIGSFGVTERDVCDHMQLRWLEPEDRR